MDAAQKEDTRPANPGPAINGMPAELELAIWVDDEHIGTLGIPQNDKLSANNNVTYTGGIQGWVLEGDFTATLMGVSIIANGTALKRSGAGVHQSHAGNPDRKGNPQVFLTGVVTLVQANGTERRYQPKVYVTHNESKGTYSITAKAFPMPSTSGPRAPVIRGTLTGSFVMATTAKAA